jgi:uncharacterized OB-fold protein
MIDLKTQSPNAIYTAHCKRGELAYQVDLDTGKAIFFPRVLAPGTGGTRLEWRVSKGLGTVYATTAVANRNAPSHNVALIDLDEGFRMMSRVEDMDAMAVTIGMRVQLRMAPAEGDQPPYPAFIPAGAGL